MVISDELLKWTNRSSWVYGLASSELLLRGCLVFLLSSLECRVRFTVFCCGYCSTDADKRLLNCCGCCSTGAVQLSSLRIGDQHTAWPLLLGWV